jgi:hypothetical protein
MAISTNTFSRAAIATVGMILVAIGTPAGQAGQSARAAEVPPIALALSIASAAA